jgi:hypothetical protein
MSFTSLPAVSIDCSIDCEYTFTAIDRANGQILAAAMSYDYESAQTKIDLQLIELGYDVYQADIID